MFLSILFVILFLLCLAGVILFPKTEGKINGLKAIVMGIMVIFCYQSLMAFFYQLIGIKVGFSSTTVSLVIADIILWGVIIRKKKVQKVFFRITDFFSIALLIGFVMAISLHMFTTDLRLAYVNSDPANHFNMAMQIVKTGTMEGIYFSAYIDATFIALLAPVFTIGNYYKAFIIADIFLHVLEICMFYVLVLSVSEKKIVRVLAPVFAIGYFFGYPTYSYMEGGYVYWSTGVMILLLIIYALLLVERYPKLRKYTFILLFLAAYANSCCNRLFVPVNYLALLAALLVILLKGKKNLFSRKVLAIIAALLAATAVAGFLFFKFWGSLEKLLSYMDTSGWTYQSMYGDLIFFIPAVILVLYFTLIKWEGSKTISIMALCMIACTIAMYVCTYNQYMSFYYYYKIYYNLWVFGWLFVVLALDIMAEKKQLVSFFSYAGMIVLIAFIVLTNYDGNMWAHNANYNGEYATKNLFSLYRYNMDHVQTDYKDYTLPEGLTDAYFYATENLEGETVAALLDDQAQYCWLDAMKGQLRSVGKKYWPQKNELPEILKRMDKNEVNYAMVGKVSEFYQANQAYFSLCDTVFETDWAVIYARPQDGWCDILGLMKDYSAEKLELYSYVEKNLDGERVPLMAAKTAGIDYVIYKEQTGQKVKDCYTWKFDARGNLDNLNELGIKYMLVLAGDEYYQSTKAYLDGQETVYENEAGKIVRCEGESWNTQYGH